METRQLLRQGQSFSLFVSVLKASLWNVQTFLMLSAELRLCAVFDISGR